MYTIPLNFRVSPDDHHALEAVAAQLQRSQSDTVRLLIRAAAVAMHEPNNTAKPSPEWRPTE